GRADPRVGRSRRGVASGRVAHFATVRETTVTRFAVRAGSDPATSCRAGVARGIGGAYFFIRPRRSRGDGYRNNHLERRGQAPGFGVRRPEPRASARDHDGGALRQRGPLDDRLSWAQRDARLLREPFPVSNPAGHGDGPRLADRWA